LRAEPEVVFARGDPGLAWCAFTVARNPLRRSPRGLRRRLHALSDRHGGARAIAPSEREIPQAYRVLSRRLREERRSPAEELTLERLVRGQFRSRGVLPDALLIATVDTEVGVWALDAERLSGGLRLAPGVVADDVGPRAAWLADPRHVTRATRRLLLYALVPRDVPWPAAQEALLLAWDVVTSAEPFALSARAAG
jgi:hypothetical protein